MAPDPNPYSTTRREPMGSYPVIHSPDLCGTDKSSTKDIWVHRGLTMRCGTCMWFVEKLRAKLPEPGEMTLGRCRRHAPTLGGWPAVYTGDWCGDHKVDEDK